MSAQTIAARLGRSWFSILVLGSATLIFVTFLSFAIEGPAPVSRLLFWIGLAGENNVGAWWSGMLLLLAAVFALDGFAVAPGPERRGWLALAGVLLVLSFDEVGSLHEYLDSLGRGYLAVLAAALLVLTCYAFVQLLRSGTGLRTPALLLLAFALLGTVPIQEVIQHSREWPNPVIYGLRAAIEEGIELGGILLLVAVTSRNTRALLEARGDAFEIGRHRALVLAVSAALAPVVVAATYVLPYPGGPADWLAAACFLGCALLVARRYLHAPQAVTAPALALFAWYLAASLGANAVQLDWDPRILGVTVSLRGLFVASLLVTAVPMLRGAGRRAPLGLFAAAALAALVGAALWPRAQLLWCAFPVLIALRVLAIESGQVAEQAAPSTSSRLTVAGPASG